MVGRNTRISPFGFGSVFGFTIFHDLVFSQYQNIIFELFRGFSAILCLGESAWECFGARVTQQPIRVKGFINFFFIREMQK